MKEKPSVLILQGAYYPGHEASGPNLSLAAMCNTLKDEFDFSVIARDRPFDGSDVRFSPEIWHELDFGRVRYVQVSHRVSRGLGSLIRETPHSLLLLNGFFDREFTNPALVLRRLGRIPAQPCLLSPRGEFSGGALAIKGGLKSYFLTFSQLVGLHRGIAFHATSSAEREDIQAVFPQSPIHLVTNFRPLFALPAHQPRVAGAPLRLAFVGRISPVKGLDYALDVLAKVQVPVRYDIFGPQSEADHWAECQRKIAALPPHISVRYRGEITNTQVAEELAAQDALFLPSKSENFGHAIFESLAAGTPVLIGDKTPWRELAAMKAGFDLPLDQPTRFVEAISQLATMPDPGLWRAAARAFAEGYVAGSEAPTQMRALFHELIATSAS